MKKILVVEDEVSLRNALRDKLTHAGFTTLEAANGSEGLEIALREHPDLVLLDVIMPVMDGMTMLKKLRTENDWGKSVPVIILTNLSSDSDQIISDVTIFEPSYYLVKSDWKLEDLIIKINDLLKQP